MKCTICNQDCGTANRHTNSMRCISALRSAVEGATVIRERTHDRKRRMFELLTERDEFVMAVRALVDVLQLEVKQLPELETVMELLPGLEAKIKTPLT